MDECCISCGRNDRTLHPIPGAFQPDKFKACAECLGRHKGLSSESDSLLTSLGAETFCLKCGAKLPILPSLKLLYCTECLSEIFGEYMNHRT